MAQVVTTKEIQDLINTGSPHVIEIKNGQAEKATGLKAFLATSFGSIGVTTLLLILFLILLNEAIGFVRIGGKTPFTLIRNIFNKV